MLRNMLRIRKHSLRIMLKPMPNSATLGQNLTLLRYVKTAVLSANVNAAFLLTRNTLSLFLKILKTSGLKKFFYCI